MISMDMNGQVNMTAKVTAEFDDSSVLQQVKNSPLASPIQNGEENGVSYTIKDSSDIVKTNSEILKEFGTNITEVSDNFRTLSDSILKANQNLNSLGQNKIAQATTDKRPLAEEDDKYQRLQAFSEITEQSTEAIKNNSEIWKEFGDTMPEMIKNFRYMNELVANVNRNLPTVGRHITSEDRKKEQIDNYKRQNFMGLVNTGSNVVQSLASGNVFGAGTSIAGGAANALNNVSAMAKIEELTGLSKSMLLAGGAITAGVAVFKGGKALADAYQKEMPTIFGTGKAFGETDNDRALGLYRLVNEKNIGTGLDTDEFNSLVQSLRKQGVGNNYRSVVNQANEAASIAQTTARLAYATGGDANQYAQLAGLMSRYGGSKDVASDLNYLVSAGKASGLNDSQIPEFLSGIQKVMEDGIAKGFTRSSTEVADTLLMFSKMSGNSAFWQGEQGARVLNQANAGIANATALNKTEDIIVYQAFSKVYDDAKMRKELGTKENNGTYVEDSRYGNMMQMIEGGLNADNFGTLMEYVKGAYPDKDAQWEAIRNMTGLNYRGAARIMNLDYTKFNNTEDLQKEIEKITKDLDNQNNETKWKESLNSMNETMATIGSKVFSLEASGLRGIANNVKKLADHFVKTPVSAPVISDNNVHRKAQEKNGELGTDYYKTAKSVSERVNEEFSEGEKALFKSRTANTWDNGDGAALEDAYNKVKNFNVYEWDEKGIIKDKKGNYKVDSTIGDLSLFGAMAEMDSDHIGQLLEKGKVSKAALSSAVENSEEFKKAFDKAKGWTGTITADKELGKLAQLLDKIYSQLEAGITVNENR